MDKFSSLSHENVENKMEFQNTVTEINTTMTNDMAETNKNTDVQPSIHEIADRSHPHSDIWICKNCSHRGDKFDVLSHIPYRKNNKK